MADKEYIEREASCKDCIHYCVCKDTVADENWGENAPKEIKEMFSPKGCENYKPTADVVEVRYGEWVYDPDGCDWGIGAWRCSLCSVKNDNLGIGINPYQFAGSKYCPHCGATMRKGGSNDEVR